MIYNFEYDYECEPIIQYFNVRKSIKTQKGICYDFAHLFTSLCQSQNILCYVLDGTRLDDVNYHHTWNQVYFDDSWRNLEVTFDNVQTKNQCELYGFRKIDNALTTDNEYFITRIY